MKNKTYLFGGVAAATILALSWGTAGEAKTVKHHRVAGPTRETLELKAQVSELKAKLDALESRLDAQSQAQQNTQAQAQAAQSAAQNAQATAQAAQVQAQADAGKIETIPGEIHQEVAAVAPDYNKIRYKGITITPGGFLAMESVYRSHQEGADIGSSFSGIPLPNVTTSHSGEDRFTARQSRLSLLAQGDVSSAIHLTGYYEMDFLGAAQTANSNESNSFQPRIRVLYSTVDWDQVFGKVQLLAGQSWSLATMNTKGIAARGEQVPLTIEAQYVVGFVWARQPQVRATASLNNGLSFAASVENPQTTFYNSGKFVTGVTAPVTGITGGSQFNSANTLSLNKYPDVIGKVAYDHDFAGHPVHVEAFGILRDFYAQTSAAGVPGGDDVTGGGAGGGAVVSVVPKILDLQVNGLEGRGIGRYGSGSLPDASFGVDGRLHPIQEYELMFGGTLHIGHAVDVYTYAGEERESAQDYVSGKVFNGIGNPNYDNTGCEVYGNSANCVGNTHYLEQVTAGFWDRAYTGKFGRFQWGIEYSYTERHIFAGYGVSGQIAGGNPAPVARENMIFTSIRYYPF